MENEKTIPALVFAPSNWTSEPNEKFGQKEKRSMLAFTYVNLQSGFTGSFHCENTTEGKEKIGMSDLLYSDLTKSPVRIFNLVFSIKEDGLNSFAKFVKVEKIAEMLHFEIKQ